MGEKEDVQVQLQVLSSFALSVSMKMAVVWSVCSQIDDPIKKPDCQWMENSLVLQDCLLKMLPRAGLKLLLDRCM